MYISAPKKYLDLPTWITLPSGRSYYVENEKDAKTWAKVAREDYLKVKDSSRSDEDKEEALADYQWAKKFAEDFPKRAIRQNERPQEQAVFPLEFDSPSGHRYVFQNWREFKDFEKPENLSKILEYEYKNDKRDRTKEQIAQALQQDIKYLRNQRDEIQERGHLEEQFAYGKGLTQKEWRKEYEKKRGEEKAKKELENKIKLEREANEKARLEKSMQEVLGTNEPPQATAAPLATVPPKATAASSPMAAPQAPKDNPKEDAMFPIKIVAPNLETGEMEEYIFNTPKEYVDIGDKVLRKLEEKLPPEVENRYANFLEAYVQGMKEAEEREKRQSTETQTTKNPAEATAAPPQATVKTPIASAPTKASAAPEQPRATEIPKTRENFYGINEPNFPINVTFPEDVIVANRNKKINSKEHYERLVQNLKEGLQKARQDGNSASAENFSKVINQIESEYNKALNERREKETPAYVKNPDGSVIDTRTNEVVDPERIRLAAAQERSSQIAGQPFKRNPYEAFPSEQNPLLKRGIEAVEDELHRQNAPQLKASQEFKYPEQNPQQKLAAAMYMNPDRGRHGFETLRDSILEQSRQRAIRRLNQSFEDLGRQYSANRMGRNSLFEAQKGRMMKDVMEDLNLLDHETELKLRAMNEQQLGGRAQFSQGQYESEAQRALEQYKMNQQRKEQELARRRQAASDAIAAGTLRQNLTEQNRARQSAEFMREQNFPREQLRSHLDELRASSLGMPAMPQEERRNVPAPRLVPQAAPPALEREIAATAGAPPQQPPAPPADTTFRDVSGAVLGGLGLKLQYDKFKADEAARQAGKP